MKTLTTFIIVTLTGVLLGASASVLADGNQSGKYDVRTKVVKFADLDLANQSDAQALLQRLQSAARNTCKRSNGSMDPVGSDRARCQAAGYQDAVAQIDGHFNIDLEEIAGVTEHGNELAASK